MTARGDDALRAFPNSILSEAVKPRLLVIEDDQTVLPLVEHCARPLGFDVHERSGRDALEQLTNLRPHVAFVDLQMSDLSGIDVLQRARLHDPDCHVILITEHASADVALRAVKAGALDCLSKPLDVDRLRELLSAITDEIAQRERLLQVDAEIASQIAFQGMVGRSAVMRELFQSVTRLAPHVRAVLITGETGTGKELVARALHDIGPCRANHFLTMDCAAVIKPLLESELFGHVRGAFPGAMDTKVGLVERAHEGTLLLDRVSELPLPMQSKLLRAVEQREIQRVGSLETRHVDVRVIATTARDLRTDVAASRFRADLFQRLSAVHLHLPPLRERREDIPYLTAAFVQAASQRAGRPIASVAPAAGRRLQDAYWPGNVRELRQVVEQACMLGEGATLSARDVEGAMAATGPASPEPSAGTESVAGQVAPAGVVPDLLTTAQRDQIARVLREVGGNKAAAAKRLGVSRRSLYRWIARLDIRI